MCVSVAIMEEKQLEAADETTKKATKLCNQCDQIARNVEDLMRQANACCTTVKGNNERIRKLRQQAQTEIHAEEANAIKLSAESLAADCTATMKKMPPLEVAAAEHTATFEKKKKKLTALMPAMLRGVNVSHARLKDATKSIKHAKTQMVDGTKNAKAELKHIQTATDGAIKRAEESCSNVAWQSQLLLTQVEHSSHKALQLCKMVDVFVETANSRAALTVQSSEAVVAAQSVATAENALADTKQHFDSTKNAWRSVALQSESELAVLLKSAASVLEEVDKLEGAIVSEKTAIAGTAAERAREHCAGIRTAGSIVQSVHETVAYSKDEASAAVKRAEAAVKTVSVGCVIV